MDVKDRDFGDRDAWGVARLTGIAAGLLLSLLLLSGARAASPASGTPPAAPASAAPSADELSRLVDTLQDPAARAKLVEQLRALIAAQRHVERQKPAPHRVFGEFSRRIDTVAGEFLAAAAALVQVPNLYGWARGQVADPVARGRWIAATIAFVEVFGIALLAELAVRGILRLLLPPLPGRRGDSRAARALFAILGFVFDALPVLAFAAVAAAVVAAGLTPATPTRIVLTVLVAATVETRLVLCVGRAVLLPKDAGSVFMPIAIETRRDLYAWVQRFACVALFGYAIAEAAWWLGVPGALYTLMLDVVGLLLTLLAVVFVLKYRRPIADWIAGAPSAASGWSRARRSLAQIWPILAILYIVAIFLVYVLHINGGFGYVLRASVLSLVVIVVTQLLVRSIAQTSRRDFAVVDGLAARLPALGRRAGRYVPVIGWTLSAIVCILAALLVLEAWGAPAFAWCSSDFGRRALGHLVVIAGVVIVALALWEIFAAAIEHHLQGLSGDAAARHTRLRTLLPLLRTAMLCAIAVIAALIILSELGVDIAPLLAGAGVIGLAVGFGSQTLVKDIITGLFILMENQLAVGEIVDLGSGHSGVVEAITVRTIQLRDQAGTVHTLPFSQVTTVKNMTKGFAFAVAKITIAYREDIDRVVEILRGVSDELMADEALQPLILDPFEYLGVDSLDQYWVTLLLRIRTLPMQQFKVGRAFNRLVKIAFDKHGIASFDPSPVVISNAPASAEEQPQPQPRLERRRA